MLLLSLGGVYSIYQIFSGYFLLTIFWVIWLGLGSSCFRWLLTVVIALRRPSDRAHVGFICSIPLTHIPHLNLSLGWSFAGKHTFTWSRWCACQSGAFANEIVSKVIFLGFCLTNISSHFSRLCHLLHRQDSKNIVKKQFKICSKFTYAFQWWENLWKFLITCRLLFVEWWSVS